MTADTTAWTRRAVVLCAGQGRRLLPLTSRLPKALLELDEGRTVLDGVLAALSAAGVLEATLVVGHAAAEVSARRAAFEADHGLFVELVDNPEHASRNNAYSLWLGLSASGGGALVVNGDTLFSPVAVRRLATAPPAPLTLAVDTIKPLGEEEMKVVFGSDGSLTRISKALDPRSAVGEYIGLARVDPGAASTVVGALERVWSRDGSLYYEDGFGEAAGDGLRVTMVEVGDLPWIEIDTPQDLDRAKMMAWHS